MLRQLSGLDSMFLYADSHRAPLEVGCLQVYDPATAPRGRVTFGEILATFRNRLERSRLFRQKLLELPFSIDNPYWVDDENFDLEYHVRQLSVSPPADWNRLMALVARLQARRLDPARPLWRAHVIEGLDAIDGMPAGSFAMFIKLHHSTVDGITGQEVQAVLHDPVPYQPDAAEQRQYPGLPSTDAPPLWRLLACSALNTTISGTRLGIGIVAALRGLFRAGLPTNIGALHAAPVTMFNQGRVTPNRVVDGCFFALRDFARIREAEPGPTVNDLALAVIGGALRRYLERHGDLPADSLLAACPVNVGSEIDALEGRGNLLDVIRPPLYTNIDDPVERLRAIHEATAAAKDYRGKLGKGTLMRIPLNLPAPVARSLYPLLFAIALQTRTRLFNTFVSNVAVREGPQYLAGARLIRVLATGPVIDQAGLFHTVISFDGQVSISFTACREMLPDPARYADCIRDAFDELRSAALRHASSRKKSTRRVAGRASAAAGTQGRGRRAAANQAM